MICPFCSPYTLPLQLPPLSWKMQKKHCLLCKLRWKDSESVNDVFNSSRGGQWWFWMQYNCKRFGKYHNTSITTWNSISSIKITTLYVMFRLRKKTERTSRNFFDEQCVELLPISACLWNNWKLEKAQKRVGDLKEKMLKKCILHIQRILLYHKLYNIKIGKILQEKSPIPQTPMPLPSSPPPPSFNPRVSNFSFEYHSWIKH